MSAKVAISTISISPHLMSAWKPFTRLVDEAVYYYHTAVHEPSRAIFGWDNEVSVRAKLVGPENRHELEEVPVLIECMRDVGLIERRLKKGLVTIYSSERWFRPPLGALRLLHPRFFAMARRFARFFDHSKFYCLPQGVHAARDMVRLIRLFHGDLRCVFRSPCLESEGVPLGNVAGFGKIRMWGYFVEMSAHQGLRRLHHPVKVLWVGRMISCKRTMTLVEAARRLPQIQFTLVGEGPEETRLKQAATGLNNVMFSKFVKKDEVRGLMRDHDVFVLASDGTEGWGATLSEALSERMCVFGTYEAGSSATILPEERLFHAGDVDGLCRLLQGELKFCDIGEWSPECGAQALANFVNEVQRT